MSAQAVANLCARLATATAAWRTLEPSMGAVVDAQEAADELQRRLARLADGDVMGEAPARTAAQLAGEVATAARRLHGLAHGFRVALPDRDTVADAERLARHLDRLLVALAAVSPKERPHD